MTPAAATWVHDHVLPDAYLAATVQGRCPCQWGACGHCTAGRHEQCPRTRGAVVRSHPDTYITSAHGYVWPGHGIPVAVWRSGRPCRWVCPCTCHTAMPALVAAPPAPAGRPRRSAAGDSYLRVASTDTTYRRDEQPALFDLGGAA